MGCSQLKCWSGRNGPGAVLGSAFDPKMLAFASVVAVPKSDLIAAYVAAVSVVVVVGVFVGVAAGVVVGVAAGVAAWVAAGVVVGTVTVVAAVE